MEYSVKAVNALDRDSNSRWTQIRASLGAWGFMGPATVLVTLFFFIPVILLLWISLTNLSSNNFGNPDFIALGNYIRLFGDRFLSKILGNTFLYVILTLGFFNVGLALGLSLLTTHINRRAGFFFRAIWLLPRITPSVIYIMMWKRLTADEPFGIINQLLGPAGLEAQNWLWTSPWLFVILVNGHRLMTYIIICFNNNFIVKRYIII